VGLVARALEMEGIATTLTTWSAAYAKPTRPPRAVYTRLDRGATLGAPYDRAQQGRVLDATLGLLARPAPQELKMRQERAD
jgi:hypothetical protein